MNVKVSSKDKNNTNQVHEKELSQIAKGAGITFIGKVLESGFKYVYIIISARILGIKSFGLFMLGLTIINLAAILSRLGLDNGVVRYVALYNGVGDKRRVKGTILQSLKFSLSASIFIGIILFLMAKPLSLKVFNKPDLEKVIKLLSISLPFISLSFIALSCTHGFQIMKYKVYGQNIFLPVLNLLLVVAFFLSGVKLTGVALAYIISMLFTSILSLYFLNRAFPANKCIDAVPETRKLLRYSIPILLLLLLNSVIQWTDTLMLGGVRTSEEVGVYNAAIKTALLTSITLDSVKAAFAPMIADLYNRKEKEKLENLFKTSTKWAYTASLPVFLLIVLLSKEIMTTFGPEYVIGRNSLAILAFSQLVNVSVGAVGLMLVMSGKQDLVMYNSLGICILNVFLNYILIPSYGIIGAAIASGVSLIALNIIMFMEVYLLLNIHPFSNKFLKPTVSGMVATGTILLITHMLTGLGGLQRMLICVPLFLTVFVLLLYRWGIDDEDKSLINVIMMKLSTATK